MPTISFRCAVCIRAGATSESLGLEERERHVKAAHDSGDEDWVQLATRNLFIAVDENGKLADWDSAHLLERLRDGSTMGGQSLIDNYLKDDPRADVGGVLHKVPGDMVACVEALLARR